MIHKKTEAIQHLPDNQYYVLDILAISRTHMSNERTLLAYINTFLAMVATGVGLVKFTNDAFFVDVGFVLLVLSSIILSVGVYRFFRLRKIIKKKVRVDTDGIASEDSFDDD